MTKQRTAAEAETAVADSIDQVVKEGGVIHEDAMWDATEMALDGASKESMVERLKKARAEAYRPKGGWMPPRG